MSTVTASSLTWVVDSKNPYPGGGVREDKTEVTSSIDNASGYGIEGLHTKLTSKLPGQADQVTTSYGQRFYSASDLLDFTETPAYPTSYQFSTQFATEPLTSAQGLLASTASFFTSVYISFSDDLFGSTVDAGLGVLNGILQTIVPPIPFYGQVIPEIGPLYGHSDVFALGNGVGTVVGIVGAIAVGNIASGASGLVACGSLAQKAAQLYTTGSTVLEAANAAVNIASTGSVGVGDALALAPAVGFGLGKLSGATYCFFAGTPVATEFGQMPIETIAPGDRVWSCDLTTGQWRLCLVSDTYILDHVGEQVSVLVAGDRIDSTYHHPYWVVGGQDLCDRPVPDHVASAEVRNASVPGRWVDAGDLRVGDVLLLMDGRRVPIEEILVRQVQDKVYNFQVEGLHNYAVGADCVLVHNQCAASNSAEAFAHPKSLLSRQGPREMDASRVRSMANDMRAGQFSFERAGAIEVAENATGVRIILDGHHRTAAAIEAGLESVPIRVQRVSSALWDQLFLQVLEAAGG